MKKFSLLIAGSLLFAAVIPASADVNIVNGDFLTASNALVTTGVGFANAPGTPIPGWTVTSGNVDWIGTYWNAPTANGGYPGGGSVDLDGTNSAGAISQTVTGLTGGQTYTLDFYLGANPDGPPTTKNVQLDVTDATPDQQTYNPKYPPSIESGGLSAWTLETFSFTLDPTATTTTISFASLDTPAEINGDSRGVSFGPVVAGVSLVGSEQGNSDASVTPEPTFYGILSIGLVGLAFFLRRRRTA